MKQDASILAVYVYGSYATRTLAPHSDIDIFIVTNDDQTSQRFLVLQENDVSIEAFLLSRTEFRRRTQRFVHGGLIHHQLATAKLAYSADRTITEIGRDLAKVAERDKELQVMRYSEWLVGCFLKAHTSLHITQDVEKSLLWFPLLARNLASVLILMNNQIIGRDVLAQAWELDNELFKEVITKIFKEALDENNLDHVLKLVKAFLVENRHQLFKPILDYLSEATDVRSATEIGDHLLKAFGSPSPETNPPWEMVAVLEWLTECGDLMPAAVPKRMTSKSRITADEAAWYYIGDV